MFFAPSESSYGLDTMDKNMAKNSSERVDDTSQVKYLGIVAQVVVSARAFLNGTTFTLKSKSNGVKLHPHIEVLITAFALDFPIKVDVQLVLQNALANTKQLISSGLIAC